MFSFTRSRLRVEYSQSRSCPKTGRLQNPVMSAYELFKINIVKFLKYFEDLKISCCCVFNQLKSNLFN